MNVDAATVVEIAATAATIIRLKRTDLFISFSFWVVLIMCTFDAHDHLSRQLLTNYDSGTPFALSKDKSFLFSFFVIFFLLIIPAIYFFERLSGYK